MNISFNFTYVLQSFKPDHVTETFSPFCDLAEEKKM